ncbi:hypothetical protein PR202_gb04263 [Eleusine coracana subsp. coracana]|uniref:Osmotin-like protein n=1 Tax=Eleusine coracana subsp. coracana TaxID=191504 RepID=A0AAV5E3C6_ELECO|nr:hypothetical protein PR202_gb04263 [Eleusine coracana subsp. coracana]
MASPKVLFLLATSLLCCGALAAADYAPMTLTVVNNCAFPVWPGIQANSGHDVLEGGGFFLPSLSHKSFPAPTRPWSGRIWARTGCTGSGAQLRCATGDCGGRLQCGGLGGGAPATLAQVSLHHGGAQLDQASAAAPAPSSPAAPPTSPAPARRSCQLRSPAGGGAVVACRSGCEAFRTDELCCRNMYNSPRTCRASKYSEFFKRECPQAFTYAHDSPSLTHQCSAPRELKVIFCH